MAKTGTNIMNMLSKLINSWSKLEFRLNLAITDTLRTVASDFYASWNRLIVKCNDYMKYSR